jgi:hypothetical protein
VLDEWRHLRPRSQVLLSYNNYRRFPENALETGASATALELTGEDHQGISGNHLSDLVAKIGNGNRMRHTSAVFERNPAGAWHDSRVGEQTAKIKARLSTGRTGMGRPGIEVMQCRILR